MAVYGLDEDEAVILQETGVNAGDFGNVDLILTSKNIIQVNKGLLGNVKDSIKYSLSNLKTLNGKANVLIGKDRGGSKRLEMYFADGMRYYRFMHSSSVSSWMRAIIKAHKNRMAEIEKYRKANSEKTSIFQSISGTIESAKNGMLAKKTPSKKICKCPKCGAELDGAKGEEVKCIYCDATVVIK